MAKAGQEAVAARAVAVRAVAVRAVMVRAEAWMGAARARVANEAAAATQMRLVACLVVARRAMGTLPSA